MDRQLDPHLQRIINNSTFSSNNVLPERSLPYASEEQSSSGWSFGPGPRQPPQEQTYFEDHADQSPFDAPFGVPYHTKPAAFPGSSRLSLAPRNIYNQHEQDPRVLSNADNHFRSALNLRECMPLNAASARPNRVQASVPSGQQRNAFSLLPNNPQPRSGIDNLANAMLMQKSMPPSQPDAEPNYFHAHQPSRINQLQPQKQQVTPPFNLSSMAYSPSARVSSSPPAAQGSSPTARISLRRASNRMPPPSTIPNVNNAMINGSFPTTPQRETYVAAKRTPQTLALEHAPPIAHGIQLVSPHELPDRFRQVFPYELFNAVQSKCFAPIYKGSDNVVVSSPTGSGKTALLELAICKVVEGHGSGQFKIVYQAPTKSLCNERMRDWQKKFSHLSLQCAELTGDTNQAEMARVRAATIIVTTPEKWDSITRKWADHHKLVHLVKLFLIDEVHILKDIRGATLEAVVSRMKTMGASVRFVALSATVPNSHDIAIWLGKDHTNQHLPAHRETFGEDFRPVKLQKHVYGFDGMMNDYAFDKVLDGKLGSLIQKHTHKKPIMVFCFTRKSCEATATMLAEWWTRQRVVDRAWPAPTQRTPVGSKELQQLVGCGVAFHHAGLAPEDRHAIETAYLKGDISLIVCTSTLAVGVNLPCHLVVLKGTVGFQDGQLVEYSDLEVMQMLGRAGRPQFDDSAVAVIMTRSDKTERYKKMISGQDVLESTLHLNLIEHLNSEISLGSVKNLYGAKKWIQRTFLNVRMQQNPNYYKIDGINSDGNADQRLELVCERDIKLLQENNLVTDNAERFDCTEYGEAMTRYMIAFETMKLLLSIPPQAKTEEILTIICNAAEFKNLRMRPQERPFLREFNKSPFIKFPIKETVTTTAHKISLIIQVQLGGIEYPTEKDFNVVRRQFLTDRSIIFERIQRLIRCVIDCKIFDRDAISTRHALDLSRSLVAEFWENSNLQLRQILNIGPVAVRKLVSNDINSIEKLNAQDTGTIERIMSKNPPFGRKTKDTLVGFPFLRLTSEIMGKAISKPGQNPKVSVTVVLSYSNDKVPIWKGRKPSLTFIAETTDGKLVHFWRGNIMKLEKGCELKFNVELSGPDEDIKCWVACEEIVGTMRSVVLKHNLPPSAFPAPRPKPIAPQQSIPTKKSSSNNTDEFGSDDLDDNEMLAVVKSIESNENHRYASEEFVEIDEIDTAKPANPKKVQKQQVFVPSVQMANGKWTCSHPCADSKELANGKKCKHRCCHEGLDKPRKEKKNNGPVTVKQEGQDAHSRVKGTIKTLDSKTAKSSSKFKLKLKDEILSDPTNAEVVNLAHDIEPGSYARVAPREYRKLHKLHNLHTSVHSDKNIPKFGKNKPQYSYSSGQQPEFGFLRKKVSAADAFELENSDDEFPSPSALLPTHMEQELSPDPYGSFSLEEVLGHSDEQVAQSSYHDDSLEAGMLELAEEEMFEAPPNPKVDSSFPDDVFDFEAFLHNDEVLLEPELSSTMEEVLKKEPSSIPGLKESSKRERSFTPELPKVKHRRITKDEPASQPNLETIPDWVNDIDSDLINEFKGLVDFVD